MAQTMNSATQSALPMTPFSDIHRAYLDPELCLLCSPVLHLLLRDACLSRVQGGEADEEPRDRAALMQKVKGQYSRRDQ